MVEYPSLAQFHEPGHPRIYRLGAYEAEVHVITRDPNSLPEFGITDEYFRLLEETIRREPQYWLWTHNRWKRTREEFNRDYEVKEGRVVRKNSP